MLRNSIIICLILALTSCGAPSTVIRSSSQTEINEERLNMQRLAFNTYNERLEKLNNLAYPLIKYSLDFCPNNIKYDIGIKTLSLNQVDRKFKTALSKGFKTGLKPFPEPPILTCHSIIRENNSGEKIQTKANYCPQKVIYVVKNSPADKAGLLKGDKIRSIKVSNSEEWEYDNIFENNEKKNYSNNEVVLSIYPRTLTEKELLDAMDDGPIEGLFERVSDPNYWKSLNKHAQEIRITPERVCGYGVNLIQNDSLNAFADGKNIYITQGMMRFVEEDRELQFIIGHELAHNMEGHVEKKTNNSILGTILDIAAGSAGVNTEGLFGSIGARMYSQEFEKEADYVGLYILSRAEIDTSNIENFWRKLAIESPGSTINYNSTHPTSPERWATIKETREEIYSKILNNLPLIPERKE